MSNENVCYNVSWQLLKDCRLMIINRNDDDDNGMTAADR